MEARAIEALRFEGRMDRERHVQLLRGGKDDVVIRMGNDLVPHCTNCRSPCWRSVGTPFAQAVADRLRADDLARDSRVSGSKQ